MLPPRPPSPPEGPPRGTYFSRRNARQPLPPSPALMRMRASSRNCIEKPSPGYGRRPLGIGTVELLGRLDVDKLAHAAPVAEIDHAGHLGEQGIVLAPADVEAGLDLGAALPDDDRTAGDELAAEDLHAEPL